MTAFRFMWRVKRHRNEKLAYAQLYLMCKAKVYANSFLQYKSKKVPKNRDFSLVRVTGLEPAHHLALEPKSNVSANFTTPAY